MANQKYKSVSLDELWPGDLFVPYIGKPVRVLSVTQTEPDILEKLAGQPSPIRVEYEHECGTDSAYYHGWDTKVKVLDVQKKRAPANFSLC